MNTVKSDQLNIVEMAKRQARLAADIDGDLLPRLQAASLSLAGTSGSVEFSFGELRQPLATGHAQAQVTLACQRCGLPVQRDLEAQFVLYLASQAAAADMAQDIDVRVVSQGQISLAELVEDELLLALPLQVCELSDCKNMPALEFPIPAQEQAAAQAGEPKENPFAVLEKLKQTPSQ